MDKLNISYSTIKKLRTDEKRRYTEYVLWEKDNEFKDYFVVGTAFHNVVERQALHGELTREIGYKYIYDMVSEHGLDETTSKKMLKEFDACYENYEASKMFGKGGEAEAKLELEYNNNYNIKWYLDRIWEWSIYDIKTVWRFEKMEPDQYSGKYEEYLEQLKLYWYVYKKIRWEEPNSCYILEVKKNKPRDGEGTRLTEFTPQEWREEEVENLLRQASIKMDWLRTLQPNDVL